MKKVFIDNLTTFRVGAALSMSKLAKLSDVDRDVISEMEKHKAVSPVKANAIMNALNAHPHYDGRLDSTVEITQVSRYGSKQKIEDEDDIEQEDSPIDSSTDAVDSPEPDDSSDSPPEDVDSPTEDSDPERNKNQENT
jgi:hypothetical protein